MRNLSATRTLVLDIPGPDPAKTRQEVRAALRQLEGPGAKLDAYENTGTPVMTPAGPGTTVTVFFRTPVETIH